jgi:hypothetical protein
MYIFIVRRLRADTPVTCVLFRVVPVVESCCKHVNTRILAQAEEAIVEAQAALVRAREALSAAEKRTEEAVKVSKIKNKEAKQKEESLEKVSQAHSRAVIAAEVTSLHVLYLH